MQTINYTIHCYTTTKYCRFSSYIHMLKYNIFFVNNKMSQNNNALESMKRNLRNVSRKAALNTARFKLMRALKKLKLAPIRSERHQAAAKKIQKAWKELNKSKIPKYKEEKSKILANEVIQLLKNIAAINLNNITNRVNKLNLTSKNNNGNSLMINTKGKNINYLRKK